MLKKKQYLKFHSVGRKYTRVFSVFAVLDFSVILNLWLRVLGNKAILVTSHNSSNDGNSKSDGYTGDLVTSLSFGWAAISCIKRHAHLDKVIVLSSIYLWSTRTPQIEQAEKYQDTKQTITNKERTGVRIEIHTICTFRLKFQRCTSPSNVLDKIHSACWKVRHNSRYYYWDTITQEN